MPVPLALKKPECVNKALRVSDWAKERSENTLKIALPCMAEASYEKQPCHSGF